MVCAGTILRAATIFDDEVNTQMANGLREKKRSGEKDWHAKCAVPLVPSLRRVTDAGCSKQLKTQKNMLKKLLALIFKPNHVATSISNSASSTDKPKVEIDAGCIIRRPSKIPAEAKYGSIPSTHGNQTTTGHSKRRHFSSSNPQSDLRNAEQLLRDGHLRIGLAGFNVDGFKISHFTRSTNVRLTEQIVDLPTQVKMVPDRNIAAGLRDSLQMLSRAPRGRTGILILTSGEPTMKAALAKELLQTAFQWRTGIHVIQVGREEVGKQQALADLVTRSILGYGRFRSVVTSEELVDALRGALDGLVPARGMLGINSVVILLDCSEWMVESFGNTTRIEMVVTALREYLRNPLLRANEKRLALAA